jgi:hypothetical protein
MQFRRCVCPVPCSAYHRNQHHKGDRDWAWCQGRSQEFYVTGAKFEFFLQSHSYSHILSQLHVLTSFTYIFVFHLGQNKRSYEAIKHGYMNNFHIRCMGF